MIIGLIFLIGVSNAFVFPGEPRLCPKPHNFSDEVYINFEKFIVPKIEVLLNQNISKRGIGTTSYFATLPQSCRPDPLSKARADVILGRINYLSETIADSRRYKRALRTRRINFLSIETEQQMRNGIIQAGEVELAKSNNHFSF